VDSGFLVDLLLVRGVTLRVGHRLVRRVRAHRFPSHELVHWLVNVQLWEVVRLVGVVLVVTGRRLGTQSIIRHDNVDVVCVFGSKIHSFLDHEESGLKYTARHYI